MRFIQKRPSRVDNQINVYEFSFGIKEVELLGALCKNAYENMPKVFETIPTKGRLRNMKRVFGEFLKERENETKINN